MSTETPSTVRPALEKLEKDHEDLVEELLEPFDSREDLFSWMIRANVRTLGVVDSDFYYNMYRDRVNLSAFLGEDVGTCDYSEKAASFTRERHAIQISNASRHAYRIFRKSAGEHFDEFEHLDLSDDNVALRPLLQETEDRQQKVLHRARRGFESRYELDSWLREANAAAFGEIPDGLDVHSLMSWDVSVLLGSGGLSPARDLVILEKVMPAFVEAVRIVRDRANESVTDNDDDSGEIGDHIGV